MKRGNFIFIFILLILLISFASAEFSTSLSVYETGEDNSSYVGEGTTFYANYSSDDGYDLGQVLYRTDDLGTGYFVRAFDYDGDGNKTDFVYSESDNIIAFFSNGTEIWNSYNSAFDYAYGMATGDFNADTQSDVAFMSSIGIFYILWGNNGSIMYSSSDYYTGYSLAVGDLDDDGIKDDFILGVQDINAGTSNNYGIVAIIGDGNTFSEDWTYLDSTSGNSNIFDVAISEVTGPNLVGYVNYQRGTGAVVWANGTEKWKDASDNGNSYSVTFYDQNSDGEEDEIAIGENSELRYYSSTGSETALTDPMGNEYEVAKLDLDGDDFYDDLLVGTNYHTLYAYNSDGSLAWTFKAPAISFESTYYNSYFTNIKVGNVNNDSLDEIIIGGYSDRYYILNLSGDIIGKHYYGFEENRNNLDYIGLTYSNNPGIDILNDTNGDGINEIVSDRTSGFVYVGQQVTCKVNINGTENYMYYNYSTKLWEYNHKFDPDDFNLSSLDSQNFIANITCEKGGYQTQTLSSIISVSLKNSSLDIFDQENDNEDNAGWLTEDVVAANETTYFFANYTDLNLNKSIRDLFFDIDWYKEFGSFENYYHDVAPMDFDGDGADDGFAYSGRDYINAYYFNGNVAWSTYDNNYEASYILKSGDFNNDSIKELAAVSSTGFLIILNYTGGEIFRSDDYYTGYTLENGDYNGDGIDELVMGVRDVNKGTGNNYGIVAFVLNSSGGWEEDWTSVAGEANVLPYEIKISQVSGENLVGYINANGLDLAVYYGNGTQKFVTSTGLASYASSFDFVDFDLDGDKDELLIGENSEAYIYNEDGTKNKTDTVPTSIIYEIREIDYDDNASTLEYVYFERYGISLINSSGGQEWYFSLEDSYYGQMEVIDINDDGIEEIIFGGYDGGLHILNKSGYEIYQVGLFNDSMVEVGEIIRIGINFYGYGQGFEFAQDTESATYLGFDIDDAYVGGGEIYPRCIIRFNDSTTARMNYNISAGLYYYNRSFTSTGAYNWNVTCESANYISRTSTATINANTPPSYVSLSNSPDTLNDLDPNTTIVVYVNVSEPNENLDTTILQWANSTGTWNNITMNNLTAKQSFINLTANFTPPYNSPDNYTYRIWANDSEGDASFSNNVTINVSWDCTWKIESGLSTAAGWDENKEIGNITINNTGDEEFLNNNCSLSFHLTHNLEVGRLYFNNWATNRWVNYYDVNSLSAGSSQLLPINTTFGDEIIEESFTISLTEVGEISNQSSSNVSSNIVSTTGGPYLYQELESYPSGSIDLTLGNYTLEGFLRNLVGDDTEDNAAYNVSFNWTLPSNFLVQDGNATLNYDNLSDSLPVYNHINITFNESNLENLSPGTVTIYFYSQAYNATGNVITHAGNITKLTDSFNITLSCYNISDGIPVDACGNLDGDYVAPPASSSVSTSSGGGGGGGGAGKSEFLQSEYYFELLRGEEQGFILPIENTKTAPKTDIQISVSGINPDYIDIIPDTIDYLAGNSTKNITIEITAPAYFTKGEYTLIFTISGKIKSNTTSTFLERKVVTLFIVEVTRDSATKMINDSKNMLEEMNNSNMTLKDVLILYEDAINFYDLVDFLEVKNNYEIIKEIHDAAFQSKGILEDLLGKIKESEKKGIETLETKKILYLAEASYKRGEYLLSLERLKEAQLTYALETKGEFNLLFTIKNNPLQTLAILVGTGFFSWGTSLAVRLRIYKRKLKLLNEEEKLLYDLMKVVQLECFEKNKLSMEEYQEAMSQYEKKLSNAVEEKIHLEAKITNLLKRKGKKKALVDEKTKIISLMKELQEDYLNRGKIETRLYQSTLSSYSKKLSEIESKLTFLEAKEILKRNKFLRRIFKRRRHEKQR